MSAVLPPVAPAQRTATATDVDLLVKVRDRAVALATRVGYPNYGKDAGGIFLDLLNVHEAVSLQLDELLQADDGQFSHDAFGIYRHFDRDSRAMRDGFCPRFVRRHY